MMSYLCEIETENLQNGDIHLARIPDFGIGFFPIFHALSFELKVAFTQQNLNSTFSATYI